MTPDQCRAARGWLNWTQVDLAEKAKVGISTVIEFEHGSRDTRAKNRAAIQAALEKRGIRFLNGATVGIAYAKPSRKKRA
jgi:DNA-binding LacI/PurR family transcriptional regulator